MMKLFVELVVRSRKKQINFQEEKPMLVEEITFVKHIMEELGKKFHIKIMGS